MVRIDLPQTQMQQQILHKAIPITQGPPPATHGQEAVEMGCCPYWRMVAGKSNAQTSRYISPSKGLLDRNLDAQTPLIREEMWLNPLVWERQIPEGVSYPGSVLWNDSFMIAK